MSWNPDNSSGDPHGRRSGRPGHSPRRHVPAYPRGERDDDGWPELNSIPPQRRSPVAILIALLIAAIFIWEALQVPPNPDARFTLVVEDRIAYAYGSTDADSFDDVRRQLDENPQLETIVLKNVPGTTHLYENTRIAQMIRARGLDTHLESGSFIASGGVDLFLAGKERTMECGALIGVHSWQDQEGQSPRTLGHDPIEDRMEDFHQSLEVDPDFYGFARDAAPHSALYFLNRDDLERFDLLTDGRCEPVGLFRFLK